MIPPRGSTWNLKTTGLNHRSILTVHVTSSLWGSHEDSSLLSDQMKSVDVLLCTTDVIVPHRENDHLEDQRSVRGPVRGPSEIMEDPPLSHALVGLPALLSAGSSPRASRLGSLHEEAELLVPHRIGTCGLRTAQPNDRQF